MYPANITRAEAAERSAQVSTHSYDVLVDLSGRVPDAGEFDPTATFVSTSTARFTTVGGPTYVNLIADRLLVATLDGTPLDDGAFADHKVHFTAEAGDHELVITAVCRFSSTGEGLHRFVDPVDDLVYCYTQLELADARRVYACFEQPDLKATFTFTVIAPEDWTVLSNSPAVSRLAGRRTRPLELRTHPTGLHLHHGADRRRVPRVTDRSPAGPREIPLSLSCRVSLAPYLDADRLFETTGPASRCSSSTSAAVPVRRLRTGLRAGVQRRRHGERRLRHDARRIPVPVPGDRGLLRGPRQHDPARAGAHVVRRPGHDDLVGRPVAQRVVR